MTVTGLFTRNQGLARSIAREFYLPGSEAQDVEQEAMIGLWIAARGWDREREASFPTFARQVIRRRLITLLRTAMLGEHALLTDASRDDIELADGPDLERIVVARETLGRLRLAVTSLTPLERLALGQAINGYPQSKQQSNAAWRARRHLRQALTPTPEAA